MIDRQLHSAEAERAIIAALLLDNGSYDRIADRLVAEDFYYASHRVMFKFLAAQISAGKSADVVTLISELKKADELENIGGREYLEQILLNTPSSSGARRYAEVIVDHRIERGLASAAEVMAELSAGAGPVSDRLDQAQKLIFALAENTGRDEPREITSVLGGFVEQLEARMARGGELSGLATGISDLDEKLDGLQNGDLVLVAGRPSMGKTALALQIADRAAMHDMGTLVFSMEMSAEQLAARSVSRLGRVNSHAIRSGKLTSDQWDGVSSAIGRLHGRPLIIDDSSSLSVEQMRARARRVKRKYGLKLVVIDYLQLMPGAGDNRNEQLSGITRGLKNMARELDVPVVLLSQLSRECEKRPGEKKRPILSDLRDSGAIEQDADVVLMIYRDEVYHPDTERRGVAELLIRKHRNGEIGEVFVTWLGEYTSFENYTGRPPPEKAPPPKNRRDAFIDA